MTDRLPSHPIDATLLPDGERWTLHMTREIAHERDAVWTAITDASEVARWAPFAPDRDLDTQGSITLTMLGDPASTTTPGNIVEMAPGRSLNLLWDTDLLRFELEATDDTTRLRLSHTFAEREPASSYAAGWHLCLSALAGCLDGLNLPSVVGQAAMEHGWPELNQQYAVLFGAAAAS